MSSEISIYFNSFYYMNAIAVLHSKYNCEERNIMLTKAHNDLIINEKNPRNFHTPYVYPFL